MRIGLVCEGPTDVVAVEHLMHDQLSRSGLKPIFRNLFPDPDNTRPEGGWSNLLFWLLNNPPDSRILKYFGGGLFGGLGAREPLDAILVQIDTDVIDDDGFRRFVHERFQLEFEPYELADDRMNAISQVAQAAGRFSELTDADRDKHVLAIAVESTESWCIAAFHAQPSSFESLRGQALINAFMHALEVSESRQPQQSYANCDKDLARRRRYCEMFASHSNRVVRSCPSFGRARDQLLRLANP